MLNWPPGPKPFDGVWAAHWYGVAHRSTASMQRKAPLPALSGAYARLAEAALPCYDRLAAYRLQT
jgi:hypothetical protein